MKVRVVLPARILGEWSDVDFVGAEGVEGSMGILPRRRDMVSPLVPGILTLRRGEEESWVAVDRGLLVKCGDTVTVVTGQATRGERLEELSRTVTREFEVLTDRERQARTALADLELRFARRFMEQQRRRRR